MFVCVYVCAQQVPPIFCMGRSLCMRLCAYAMCDIYIHVCVPSANFSQFSPKLTKTATLKPWFVSSFPNASISVDFPAPGGPDNPILSVGLRVPSCCCLLWWESTFVSNHCACLCFTGCLLSTTNIKWIEVKGQSFQSILAGGE